MRLLNGVSAVAALGSWTFSILLALYAYYEEGAVGVGAAVAVRMLPAALAAAPARRLLATRGRREVLVASALAQFAMLEALAVAAAADLPFALLLVPAAAYQVAGAPQRAMRAAVPGGGPSLHRTPLETVGFLAGALLAGILASAASGAAGFAVTGAAFLVVAALAARLPRGRAAGSPASARHVVPRDARARLRVGIFAATTLAESMLELLLVVAAVDLLAMGSSGVGWLRAGAAAGALAGGALAAALLRRERVAPGLAAGLVLAGVPLALVGHAEAGVAVALLAVVGAGYALADAALSAIAPDAVVERAEDLAHPVARALGAVLAAWLVTAVGDRDALLVSAALLPVIALAAYGGLARVERGARRPRAPVGRATSP
ncbi:MAG: hypothetical protein QOG63_1153 [Thermoleophilaceae bacterium]|nr:hypothetical protein [Thermoleophilaceae bacterium]